MKIIYCHHANRKRGNPSTQEDGLTSIGVKDAKLVAKLFRDMNKKWEGKVKAIYTSEFYRCTKTTEIINKYIKLPVIVEPRLNEHKSNKDETWLDTQNRITEVIDEIISKYEKDDVVICVTSGLNIAPFISKQYGLKPDEKTPFIGVPNCCPIVFEY